MENENLPFQAKAKLWSYTYGFAQSLILRCAVQLDLATVVHNHGTPMSLAEICPQLPIQPVNQVALFRLMRYLVHMNLFTTTCSHGEAKYGLAPPGRLLVKGQENCMVSSILAITDKEFMAPWHYLKDGLSCERGTSFEKALGTDIWGYMAEHPEKNHLFNEAMANDTMLIMSAMVKECENIFAGVHTLVDVGGGTGTAVRTIAKAFPHIKCTVYDLPHVIHDSPGYSDVKFVKGDMFKSIPNADAIMLKCILHDWDDQECIEILKRCKEAVSRDGGKVIIIDVVLNADTEHPYTKMRLTLDLDMMINTGGKERTEEEWKNLFFSAGYKGYKIRDIPAVQSVIEVYPGLLLLGNTS